LSEDDEKHNLIYSTSSQFPSLNFERIQKVFLVGTTFKVKDRHKYMHAILLRGFAVDFSLNSREYWSKVQRILVLTISTFII